MDAAIYRKDVMQFEDCIVQIRSANGLPVPPTTFNKRNDGSYVMKDIDDIRTGWDLRVKSMKDTPLESVLANSADDSVVKYMSEAKGILFATDDEFNQWQTYVHKNDPSISVTEDVGGYLPTVGYLAGYPVCISVRRIIANRKMLLKVTDTSTIVDHDLIATWLKKYGPSTIIREGGHLISEYIGSIDSLIRSVK